MNNTPDSPSALALISVSDKTGIIEFATRLSRIGFGLISTGGTAKALADAGLPVTEVSDYTGFPEIMGGRVKTLHPRIHGGLLGREGVDESVMSEQDIPRIDIAVINLYPFESVTGKPDCRFEDAIENIDIGGPAMVRSAAKNFDAVAIVTSPDQYDGVLAKLQSGGGKLDQATRHELAVAAFNRIAQYDAAISNYLSSRTPDGDVSPFPGQANACFTKVADLRYGENPHQQAAWYRDIHPAPGSLANARQHQGKELSYNNIADADAAWECVRQFDGTACAIIKHANPCGVAVAGTPAEAYDLAFATDPTSAFGGIIAFNQPLDAQTASGIAERQFLEVLIAPAFEPAALDVLAAKKNVRVLEIPVGAPTRQQEAKRIGSGLLIQTSDFKPLTRDMCRVVSKRQPDEQQWLDLLFAWKVARMVKSNAIVYVAGGRTVGIGAGQMSRVDSARIGRWKAEDAGLPIQGAVMSSDAFFPFRDGIDTAGEAGIAAVIQPGGSMRDDEVIAAADEHGMAMVFTGIRHFRH
ncbi:MAG: bifunctional phosphoribosylaminoimidazolecarboxamide formyltransferase/IMP cyclohydrolase [Xanthomonadales bacterium]|nr:bifunctional phosphoribosylaminoimidazolecarboxamide formyltransferase/IMP cyclohydrolase [Gammaproteobacteria bacterium]MBT8054233.1 bifunctional phosphoribosylaminoimidazolecarboxamide formyltransferase/IMP cyclohydrolase [Gammaproteobacteria bacterium]NND57574.1 bifunctional phosphoribosylaminoimidazolecarboxamide formyltransferase/IMP cyclohydrolase [Xanthomonadales bacterium]NNK51298.1 bifunctional phosphoribosylaminoimidazolecarboxamide formyltransferase/IMP cyclohydrolase [Xanthomonada